MYAGRANGSERRSGETLKLNFGMPSSFPDLLRGIPDMEFKNLVRSTVPLLAFWAEPRNVEALTRTIGFTAAPARTTFEYPDPPGEAPSGGSGLSSFTDVVLEWGDVDAPEAVVGVKATHTEGLYARVEKPVAYPLLCRIASATSRSARTRTVMLHLLLTDASKKCAKYVMEVRNLAAVVRGVAAPEFWVVSVDCRPHSLRAEFESALPWSDKGRAERVREALGAGKPLFEFGEDGYPVAVLARRRTSPPCTRMTRQITRCRRLWSEDVTPSARVLRWPS